MSKFKIGYIKRFSNQLIASCSCNTVLLLDSPAWKRLETNPKCEKCNNTNFIRLGDDKRALHPYIQIIDKNRKGFKAKRTNLSISYDEDFNVVIKENMVQILIYNLVDRKIKLFKNGEDMKIQSQHYEGETIGFFTSLDHSQFKEMVSTEDTRELYDFAWDYLAKGKKRSYAKRFNRALVRLFNYPYMQILANAGFPNIKRFYEPRIVRNSWNTPNYTINPEGTTPKDILGVPKFVLKHLRENDNISLYEIKQIKLALKKGTDPNNFKELMEIVKDESTIGNLCSALDIFTELTKKYQYTNMKRLALYLFRELRMNQGIQNPSNGAILLRDYARMSTALEQEFEKYPKSLKKEHDITQMNYKVTLSESKRTAFIVAVEDYKKFEYKKKEYSIITPTEMQDLVKEGSDLSHCVASYVDSVIDKKCKIFFLRKTNALDESLATVEVRGENVRQAKGYANRKLRLEEKDFIAEWAKNKELVLNYY